MRTRTDLEAAADGAHGLHRRVVPWGEHERNPGLLETGADALRTKVDGNAQCLRRG